VKCLRIAQRFCAGWRHLSSKLSSRRLINLICFCVTFQRGPFLFSLNILNRAERVFYFFTFLPKRGAAGTPLEPTSPPSLPACASRLTRPPVCAGGGGYWFFLYPAQVSRNDMRWSSKYLESWGGQQATSPRSTPTQNPANSTPHVTRRAPASRAARY
jgi:hypothetical protein